jgi:16S rRNA (guanine527-N7)-methyltransferase
MDPEASMASGGRDMAGPVTVDGGVDPLDNDGRLPEYFGDAWPAVNGFARLLRAHGVERGLLGPNEAVRLWERHLLNSAGVVASLPTTGTLVDLGSGGGLPGIVLAAMRPQARVVLLEPMERRTDWLRYVVDELKLRNTEVLRGRAEDVSGDLLADALTARAVSSLENLFGWAAPLVRAGGGFHAIKGGRAADEVAAAATAARRNGWSQVRVDEVGTLEGVEVTRVVRAVREGGPTRVR